MKKVQFASGKSFVHVLFITGKTIAFKQLCLSWISNLSVWKEVNDFGIMETRRLAAIFNMVKQVLVFCLKLHYTLENYNKDLAPSTVHTSLLLTVTDFV